LDPDQVREVFLSRHFSGPLPPPEVLDDYGQIIPNAPERFFRIWEQEVSHRRELEQAQIRDQRELQQAQIRDRQQLREAQIRERRRTQACAMILALSVLTASVYFISQGHEAAGTSVLLVEMIALAALFLGGRSTKSGASAPSPESEQESAPPP